MGDQRQACPSCGILNSATVSFCAECGSRLAPVRTIGALIPPPPRPRAGLPERLPQRTRVTAPLGAWAVACSLAVPGVLLLSLALAGLGGRSAHEVSAVVAGLSPLLWVSALVLALIARARGERRLAKIAIIICLVELGLPILAVLAIIVLILIYGLPGY